MAKMAASLAEVKGREILSCTDMVDSIDTNPIFPQEKSWMTPLLEYILTSRLPEDLSQEKKIKRQAFWFVISNGVWYRRSFQGPLLKCLSREDTKYVLREVHEECYEDLIEEASLERKALLARFWWPTMNFDSRNII